MEKYFESIKEKEVKASEIKEFAPTGDFEGIKAITYDGAEIHGKKTKVFAYLGYPEHMTEKAPAVLLIHGGGGKPYLEWVKMWNERGYVALAMSTTGDFPTKVNAGSPDAKKGCWTYGLTGIFEEEGYFNAPENDAMRHSEKAPEDQWMYHAVSQVILAHNVLRDDERVDEKRIGIVGISWGGVITSIAIGYDNRFAFAVPIYGSGYLSEDKGTIGEFFGDDMVFDPWRAEKSFSKVKMPVLWLCWNKDTCFSVNSNSKSYFDTVKNNEDTRLSIVHEMYHDHPWGWIRKEPYAFADAVCCGKKRLPTFKREGDGFKIINPDNARVAFVKLYYLDTPYEYTDRTAKVDWKIFDFNYDGKERVYEVPKSAKAYYLEMTTLMYTDIYVTTSEFVER
ncbi:MAG: acetylxylan esterase [Clostridia bacterium]|nr:acetylxylan esterase [Clostridia bacterium]